MTPEIKLRIGEVLSRCAKLSMTFEGADHIMLQPTYARRERQD